MTTFWKFNAEACEIKSSFKYNNKYQCHSIFLCHVHKDFTFNVNFSKLNCKLRMGNSFNP